MYIRTMEIEDYANVYDLWTQTEGMGLRSLDDSKEGIHKFLKRNPTTCFVCEIHNDIAGVILCGHDGRRAYIYHMTVSESHRNKGIGRLLVSSVLNALETEGIKKAALLVFKDNTHGNPFWESLGFRVRDDLYYRDKPIDMENI